MTPNVAITLKASELRNLITPVLPLAADDGGHPILNAVLIETGGAYVTALATDRYRLGMKRIKPAEAPAPGFSVLASVADLRQVLSLFKPTRRDDLTLTITLDGEGGFSVEAGGAMFGFMAARMVWRIVSGTYPNVRKILRDALAAAPGIGDVVAFNPHYLADFKIAANRGEAMRLWGGDSSRPFAVAIGDDFVGVIMPKPSGEKAPGYDVDTWAPLLGTPDEEAVADKPQPSRKRTSRTKGAAA